MENARVDTQHGHCTVYQFSLSTKANLNNYDQGYLKNDSLGRFVYIPSMSQSILG